MFQTRGQDDAVLHPAGHTVQGFVPLLSGLTLNVSEVLQQMNK